MQSPNPVPHPIVDFARYQAPVEEVDAAFFRNFVGARQRREFVTGMGAEVAEEEGALPALNEELFEWIALLASIEEAREKFVMIELGAGFGRWLVNAACALRVANPLPCELIGVEAEPKHFEWMQQHFRHNGLDPDAHQLIQAAVAAQDGEVEFIVGGGAEWYGQSIYASTRQRLQPLGVRFALRHPRAFLMNRAHFLRDRLRPSALYHSADGVVKVPAVSLQSLLEPFARVDHMDADIQGAEGKVFCAAIGALNSKVRRVHIETHTPEVDAQLRALFCAYGWTCTGDFYGESETPFGRVTFQGGAQTWENPRLSRYYKSYLAVR